jgi:hypothetical protein
MADAGAPWAPDTQPVATFRQVRLAGRPRPAAPTKSRPLVRTARQGWPAAAVGTVHSPGARSIWSGTISFGHIDNFPHQT